MNLPDQEAPQNAFLAAWARFVLRFRWLLTGILLIIGVSTTQFVASNLTVDNNQEKFLEGDSDARKAMDELIDAFGADELFVLVIEGDVFSMAYLERLRDLHNELSAISVEQVGEIVLEEQATDSDSEQAADAALADDEWAGLEGDDGWGDEGGGTVIDNVTSLINVSQTEWRDGGLQVFGLLDDWPTAAELPALREHVMSDDNLAGYVVSSDAHHSVLVVQGVPMPQVNEDQLYLELNRVADSYQSPDFHIQIGGAAALYTALNFLAVEDLVRLGMAECVALFICLFFLYRHPIGALAPLLAVGQAVLWTLGVMVLSSIPMTMVTTVLWAFLFCVGVGGAIHVQSVYRDARRDGQSNDDAIVFAISTTGVPVFLTSATTAAGLLSFGLATLEPIQNLGFLSAFGVGVAFVQTMVFVPIALSFNRHSHLGVAPAKREQPDLMDRALGFSGGLSSTVPGRRGVLTGVALLMALAGAGISVLDVSHDTFSFMPKEHPVRDAFHWLDRDFGGSNTMSVLVEAHPGQDLQDLEVLSALERLEKHMLAYTDADGVKLVSTPTGILDVVRQSWTAVNADDPAANGVLPPTSRGIADMLTLFSSSDPTELARHITVDRRKAVLHVRVLWRDSSEYRPLVLYMNEAIDEIMGEVARVVPAGSVLNHYHVESLILGDLYRSFGMATIVITLLIITLLRNVRLGLVAMLPNLVPVAIVLGYMGLAGIRLDVQNLLVSSVVIGIAVDDTIHFMHQFKAHHDLHGDTEGAIHHALQHAGRAIIGTSIVLVIGFGTFTFSRMENIQVFGQLTALAVSAALISDLLFAPALLRWVYAQRSPKS